MSNHSFHLIWVMAMVTDGDWVRKTCSHSPCWLCKGVALNEIAKSHFFEPPSAHCNSVSATRKDNRDTVVSGRTFTESGGETDQGTTMRWEVFRAPPSGMLASVHIHETTQVDLPDVLLLSLPLSCLATTCTGWVLTQQQVREEHKVHLH